MFMVGCAPELDDRRDRINCREIVTRNVLALSAGVRRTVCWHLAPEVANFQDPFTMMELMHGKLPLLGYEEGRLGRRHPSANAFRRLAAQLDGAVSVDPLVLDGQPDVRAFTVERSPRPPLTIAWRDGDVFAGEDRPATPAALPWAFESAHAVDAMGARQPLRLRDGVLEMEVSVTPVLVSA
jgi:hypothetical protein